MGKPMMAVLSAELSGVDGINNISEERQKSNRKETKAVEINFDYLKFPLSALEVIGEGAIRFINIRLTISYSKEKYPINETAKILNGFNAKSMCVKAFYIESENSDEYDIAYNIEDVVDSDYVFQPAMIERKITMIVRAPTEVHKVMDGK